MHFTWLRLSHFRACAKMVLYSGIPDVENVGVYKS